MSDQNVPPSLQKLGTPKNLRELLYHIVLTPGPRARLEKWGIAILKDYLAQKFGAFVLEHPEHEELIMKLFERCAEIGEIKGPHDETR